VRPVVAIDEGVLVSNLRRACGPALALVLAAGAVGVATFAAPADEAPSPHVARIAGGYAHTVLIGADGRPYGLGANTNGQLALETNANGIALTEMTGLPAGATAVGVAAGGYLSLVLGSDGVVYATGNDQVTGGLTDGVVRTLTALGGLPTGVTATDVAAGNYHAVVLGSDGKAYGIGDNAKGQLTGVTTTPTTLTVMSGLPDGVSAVDVAAGYYETYVVGSDGVAYGTGRNQNGELTGSGQKDTLTAMTGLPEGVTAVRVEGGDAHSLVIGSDGQVYGTGYNAHGQLTGTGSKSALTKLTGLPEGVTATDIAAGFQHSVVLGSDGVMYGAGFNDHGQVTGSGDVLTLTPLTGLPVGVTATDISVGDNFSLARGSDDVFYGAGDNRWGQLTAGVDDQTTLSMVPGQPLVNTALPKINRRPSVAGVVTTSTGSWTPTPTSYAYQWWVGGKAVPGATDPTYGVQGADVGKQVRVTVTAVRDGFQSTTASSLSTAEVPAVDSRVRATFINENQLLAGKKGGRVLVEMLSVPPTVEVTGKVRLTDTFAKGRKKVTRTVATKALKNGSVSITLPRLTPGKHTMVVRYLGSSTVHASASKKVVFKVK
jgi:alpha-tubulin suppressor-like RCC1 family protein